MYFAFMNKLFFLITIIISNCFYTNYHGANHINDYDFSSYIDPEECYSIEKACEDIGVFNEMNYDGQGIKIGIVENGIPENLSIDEKLYHCFGTTETYHATAVASTLKLVAPNATFYYASKTDHSFEQCLDWFTNVVHVDIINHSAAFYDGCEGYYYNENANFIDKYIRSSNVVFVNSLGNKSSSNYITGIAMGINVISVAANNHNLAYSSRINSYETKDEIETIISKPTCLAPGESLYGFNWQNLEVLDRINDNYSSLNINSYTLSGTSYSSPLVAGIIALLMQEFPSLKGHPEIIQAIIGCSTENGILNYQLARQCAKNYFSYVIPTNPLENDVLLNTQVVIPQLSSINISNFILFNGVPYDENHAPYIKKREIQFSKVKISIVDEYEQVVFESESIQSIISFEFTNNTDSTTFNIKIQLNGAKPTVGIEKACFCYRIDKEADNFSLQITDYNLDTMPLFTWNVSTHSANDTVSLVFKNYKRQSVLIKENIGNQGQYRLTQNEWHTILDMRGREFYVYIKLIDSEGIDYYSNNYTLYEPKTFYHLHNLNPSDFNFDEQYYFYEQTTSIIVDDIAIQTRRLRCGYVEDQYINLSAKRANAGHAFLELRFDRLISYLAFGVTIWKNYELLTTDNDSAIVYVLTANNVWVELIDLLNEHVLPISRRDVARFDVQNVYGIKFEVYSNPTGNRNKGRLCIDNVSFTDDNNWSSYLTSFYEPIVVRENFSNYIA